MPEKIIFALSFYGKKADDHQINFYDVVQALSGFQRSLALTTHLVLNDEIITHAPALNGATIEALPPEPGSWKVMAAVTVLLGGVYKLGTTPKDTPIGNLVYSAYDYVISESLGFHVDFNKSLGQQYDELKTSHPFIPKLEQNRLDSLVEKCEVPITDIHRPIVSKKTASTALITMEVGSEIRKVGHQFNLSTFEYIYQTKRSKDTVSVRGRISSYNSNTFKGRVYLPDYGRPVPFELMESAKDHTSIALITGSLTINALRGVSDKEVGYVQFLVYLHTSKSGALKSVDITQVSAS